MSEINFINWDCMDWMKDCPDNYYGIAICDIPYGIGVGKMAYLKEMNTTVLQKNGTRLNGNSNKKPYKQKDWDKTPPPQEYFNELKRCCEHQIIFGVEYVNWDGLGTGRIKWNKGVADGMSFKKYEMAYCSLIDEVIDLDLLWAGMMQAKSLNEPMVQQGNKKLNEKRIHPTQKPILLYKKLIMDYAIQGKRILDTHGGSMSIAIAADYLGFDLDICEIDKDYYDNGKKRYENYKCQTKLF